MAQDRPEGVAAVAVPDSNGGWPDPGEPVAPLRKGTVGTTIQLGGESGRRSDKQAGHVAGLLGVSELTRGHGRGTPKEVDVPELAPGSLDERAHPRLVLE